MRSSQACLAWVALSAAAAQSVGPDSVCLSIANRTSLASLAESEPVKCTHLDHVTKKDPTNLASKYECEQYYEWCVTNNGGCRLSGSSIEASFGGSLPLLSFSFVATT